MTRVQAAWLTIALAGAGTYAIRVVLWLFADRAEQLPDRVRVALRMIPPAALAALVTPPLLRPGGALDPLSPELLAGLAAFAVAWFTKNVVATLLVGMVVVVALAQVL